MSVTCYKWLRREAAFEIIGLEQPDVDRVEQIIAKYDQSIRSEIETRIAIARTEKAAAERAGYQRDALRLDGALGALENLLEDTLTTGELTDQ